MIRASGETASGRRLIVLGLSDENIKRLRDGKPIRVEGEPLGFTGDIVIITGPDEVSMVADLQAALAGQK